MSKIGAKVLLTVNLDIKDRLNNGQTGNISHNEFAQGSIRKVYAKVPDEQASLKATRYSYLDTQNSCVSIKNVKLTLQKRSTSASINRTHFHLTLA